MKLKDLAVNLWNKILQYKEIAVNVVCGLLMLSLLTDLFYYGKAKAGFVIFNLIGKSLGLCLTTEFYVVACILAIVCHIAKIPWFRFLLLTGALWLFCLTP